MTEHALRIVTRFLENADKNVVLQLEEKAFRDILSAPGQPGRFIVCARCCCSSYRPRSEARWPSKTSPIVIDASCFGSSQFRCLQCFDFVVIMI